MDKDKVFITNRGALEGRIDAFYYLPSFVELESKVLKQANGRLKDFMMKVASGATPSIQEETRFYSDKENGIPFIRVQNLSPTNELLLDDLKYINKDTHENYLKRSQVAEYDLLVKITGVGRMAVASVAPTGFVGNTNQHLVVIKTTSKEVSEAIATFLNTEIGERLASRRATGGTRPALDYTALKSIPIILNEQITTVMDSAVKVKRQKEAEAKQLLASIDDYLLGELGIVLSPPSPPQGGEEASFPPLGGVGGGKGQKPFFYTTAQELTGNRWDATFYRERINLSSFVKLKNLVKIKGGKRLPMGSNYSNEETEYLYLRVDNIKEGGYINQADLKFISSEIYEILKNYEIQEGDVIISIAGTVGKVAIIPPILNKKVILTENCAKLQLQNNQITPSYLQLILTSSIVQRQINLAYIQTTIPKLGLERIYDLHIPLPPLSKQREIATHISELRAKAKRLTSEAAAELAAAKAEVERRILGEV